MRHRAPILVAIFLAALSAAAQIPSPESQLGFKVGDDRKLADWSQVVSYFQKVAAAAPDRVRFEELGKSTLGKPFVALTISSRDNMRQLSRYLQIQQRLADPRGLSEQDAQQLINEGKAVVMITCSVHSTEVASTQTAMEYVYRLLTEDTPEHREILNNIIFLLVPSLNPDGQDMVVKWYRKYVGTPFEGSQPVELYHPYVGHDNNRDWYMFTQVETQLTVSKLHNIWHPEVVYDVHQMGSYAARLFVPPFLDPVDPNIDPLLVQETNMLGTAMAADLASNGKTGVAVNAIYDFWTPARHYQAYHGGLRILTESASARIASPIHIRFDELDANSLGYSARRASWNFPDPWKGGDWRLRDIVDYQLIAFESCLHHVAQNRAMFLRNFYQLGVRAVNRTAGPYAFVVPGDQRDLPTTIKMLQTLQFGQVEISMAGSAFVADGMPFPEGSIVILLNQPYGAYAKTLLERQKYPDLREYPGGPPKRPYDVTAQTLPLLMGVKVYEIEQPFKAELKKMHELSMNISDGPLKPHGSGTRYFFLPANSPYAFQQVNRALKAGSSIFRLSAPMHDHGQDFAPGAFVISSATYVPGDAAAFTSVPAKLETGAFTQGNSLPPSAVPLKSPRIGLYTSYIPSMDEGWTRWLLEQFEFPYTRIYDKDIRAGDLASRFDVIVIPDQSVNAIVNGHPRPGAETPREGAGSFEERTLGLSGGPRVPDEFTGGIGSVGVNNLRAFATQGGTLVLLNSASNLATERLGIGARNMLSGVANKDFYGPGSILRVNLDTSSPLAWGMDRETAIWFEHSPAFAPAFDKASNDVITVASYPAGNPLMSGWLLGDSLLQDRSALLDAPLGRGHVVMFGFRPQYRGQSYGTFKMLFNALYYFGPVAQPSVADRVGRGTASAVP